MTKPIPDTDDMRMVMNPDRWPAWPYLPVKKRDHNFEDKNLGVLIATEPRTWVVYHTNVFDRPTTMAEWEALPKTEYPSAYDMLADGWVVD